jgi:hypothetical protein
MSTAEVTGLFGLGGVVLGGAMAMLSARWQAAANSKGRIAELEVQLRNERVLRDEAARRTAILEMLAIFERLSSAVVTATMIHSGHGKRERDDGKLCELRAMPDVITTGTEFYAAHQERTSSSHAAAASWYAAANAVSEGRDSVPSLASRLGPAG